jgi:hypothetical protein
MQQRAQLRHELGKYRKIPLFLEKKFAPNLGPPETNASCSSKKKRTEQQQLNKTPLTFRSLFTIAPTPFFH